MANISVRIADFSTYPVGRDDDDSEFNGTKFRKEVLFPAIQRALEGKDDLVVVILDGVLSFGSSFLEEAFGGLVRDGLKPADIRRVLRVSAEAPVYQTYKRQIEKHLREAAAA